MYSRQAIELYGELLKTAGSTVSAEFEKTAFLNKLRGLLGRGAGNAGRLQVPSNLGVRPAVSEGSRNLVDSMLQTSAVAPTAQAPRQPGRLSQLFSRTPRPNAVPSAAPPAPPPPDWYEVANQAYGQGQRALADPTSHRGTMLGLAGLGLGGAGGYLGGTSVQANRDKTQRNLAFGAGAATGLIAPSVLRGIADTAQTVALSPSSLIPGRGY